MLHVVGRIPKTKQVFEPAGHRNDRTIMRKGLEPVFAVVSPGARVAYAAERSIIDRGVEQELQIRGRQSSLSTRLGIK